MFVIFAHVVIVEQKDSLLAQNREKFHMILNLKHRQCYNARRQHNCSIDPLSILVLVCGKAIEKLRRSLAVANVRNTFIATFFDDFVEHCRDVVFAHFLPRGVILFAVLSWIAIFFALFFVSFWIATVFVGISCGTVIAKPHVIALISELKERRNASCVSL